MVCISELLRMKKTLQNIQHWGLVAVMIDFHFTLRHFKQLAKNFFISASVPGRNFRERWVRCLKGLVSTTFKETGVWSRAGAEDTNCSKNLGKKQDNQMFSFFFSEITLDAKLFPNKMYFYMCSKRLKAQFLLKKKFSSQDSGFASYIHQLIFRLGQVRLSFFTDSSQSEWLTSILRTQQVHTE